MTYKIVRTDAEVAEKMAEVNSAIDRGTTRFRGGTIEEGIKAMFEWLTNAAADDPYPPR